MNTRAVVALAWWLGLTAASQAQAPAFSKMLPEGFTVVTERNQAHLVLVEATKSNANFPKPHSDQGIVIGITWSPNPAASTVVKTLAGQPEDPVGPATGVTREEPSGRMPYRNGVLTWRKAITPWVGTGEAPDLITWRGAWVGVAFKGLLGIGVSNFFGSREQAQALIDGIIEKVNKAQ
jgi:hypothetical protein